MQLHQAFGNRKTKSGSPVFHFRKLATIKAFKNNLLFLRRNTAASVNDTCLDHVVLFSFSDFHSYGSGWFCKFKSIGDEVGENLNEFVPVALDKADRL